MGKVNHNWGDWYTYDDCTMIRVYGFEATPFLLPKIVPDKIAYLEIVRQLVYSDYMHLKSYNK